MSKKLVPEYIFETSWEVCNMVGGIYTVLSTRARTLVKEHGDKLIFVGPDVWKEQESPYFDEETNLLKEWKESFEKEHSLKVKVGRWSVPGTPVAILVDFTPLYEKENEIYGKVWEDHRVDSMHAYGDYDEASMFGYASGMVMAHYYEFHKLTKRSHVAAHFNEWMTSFGAFYLHSNRPEIATLFTTHATSIGRSIAGNNKPLYDYFDGYNGDQMASELNMVSKHSTEKNVAHLVDSFTTVSHITARECTQLLEKTPHVVTPNGFEDNFVPKGKKHSEKREEARETLKNVAETLLGYTLQDDVKFVATAGRYEYKNKGLDIFMESLKMLSHHPELTREVVAFIMVPAHIKGARQDLADRLENSAAPMDYHNRYTTHELHNFDGDSVISTLRWLNIRNEEGEKVKVVFVPSYLNGNDGIFNKTYWDLLIGMDLSVFPSYYEPWGYTPLESVAFSVPTITTNLSGFGQWVMATEPGNAGVMVVERTDSNLHEASEAIAGHIFDIVSKNKTASAQVQRSARQLSKKALWKEFIHHYHEAYDIALKNRNKRLKS